VTPEQVERACRTLPEFFERVISTASLIEDALKHARLLDHPVYDCVYLACAHRQGTKLITADQKFVSQLRANHLGHLVASLDDTAALTLAQTDIGLSISEGELSRVLGLSDQFRNTLASVEEQVGRPIGGSSLKWVNAVDLVPAFESPARRRLEQAIRTLSHDDMSDLVALAWLGRGYDGHDWAYLRADAHAMLGNDPTQHLGYMISLLSYVQAGIQKISETRTTPQDQSNPDSKPET